MGYIYKKSKIKMTSLHIVFNAGSIYEEKGKYGTMHLMEHLICNTFMDMCKNFTKNNIAWNAETDEELVSFYAEGLDSRFTAEMKKEMVYKILNKFEERVTEDFFEKEKETVLKEYYKTFNDPNDGGFHNYFRKHYNNFMPIGYAEDIKNFTLKDAVETYKKYFSKPARIIEIGPTKTDFGNIEYNEKLPKHRKLVWKKNSKLPMENIPTSVNSIVYCFGKTPVSKADFTYVWFGLKMLNYHLDSPLYVEIRGKRSLSYYSRAYIHPCIDKGYVRLCAETDNDKAQQLMDLYKDIFAHIEDYLTEERFNDIMGLVKCLIEEEKIMKYQNCDDLIRKGLIQPKSIEKITYPKLVEVMKKVFTSEFDITIINETSNNGEENG